MIIIMVLFFDILFVVFFEIFFYILFEVFKKLINGILMVKIMKLYLYNVCFFI